MACQMLFLIIVMGCITEAFFFCMSRQITVLTSERREGRNGERERESESCSQFGSSTAPLLGGLCRLLASGEMCGVDPRLFTLGETSHLSQRCLSTHICCRFASGKLRQA